VEIWDWEPVKQAIKAQNTTQEWVAEKAGVPFNTFRGWITKGIEPRLGDAFRIADTLGVSLEILAGREFMVPSGKSVALRGFEVATLVPQTISAGGGQELLNYTNEELVQKAPYPKRWGKALMAMEVRGDSMTRVNIFDGDIVFYAPGDIRADGIYVLQLDGGMFVKRLQFEMSGKINIHSENPKYDSVVEHFNSQAMIILGKVRGWLHEHPY
jgi:phage repressor protein C with HTH and peptisase S24 domain